MAKALLPMALKFFVRAHNIDVLHRCGLSGLVAGEGVALGVIKGERGLMAVPVLSWEAAQSDK